jgi:hypothetical protein
MFTSTSQATPYTKQGNEGGKFPSFESQNMEIQYVIDGKIRCKSDPRMFDNPYDRKNKIDELYKA